MTPIDNLIIGSGLSGLLLARLLESQGQSFSLVEARDTLGGSSRHLAHLDFYPPTEEAFQLINWMKSLVDFNLDVTMSEHRPQVFDEGRFRAFSGFGESRFESIEALAYFNHTHQIALSPKWSTLLSLLAERLPSEAQLRAEVTELHVVEGAVREVTINGDRKIPVNRVFLTPSPTLLNSLIEGEALPAKHRARLSKMVTWTGACLELEHSSALAEEQDGSIRLFSHAAKEFEPVVGRIEGNRSLWMTLVSGERDGDNEFLGQSIRHIKRQLKRAWPELAIVNEKISVQPQAFGQYSLKTKEPFRLPEISNLFLVNSVLGSQPGPIGSIEAVKWVKQCLFESGSRASDKANSNQLPTAEPSC